MDLFREEVVLRRNQTLQNVTYAMAFVMMIVCGAYAVFNLNLTLVMISTQGFNSDMLFQIITLLITVGLVAFLFLYKDRLKTEFEYTFTNGIMDFAQVFNNKKRKNLGTMNIRNTEACGYVTSGSFHRYLNMPGIKKTHWFLNRDAELFYFYYVKNGEKHLLVIEPSEEMVKMIRMTVRDKFQVN